MKDIKESYCVLWMPCSSHGIHNILDKDKVIKINDFSDGMEKSIDEKLFIEISLINEDREDFRIIVKDGNGAPTEYSFDFLLDSKSGNGLHQYKFLRKIESPLFRNNTFPPAIYHKLKEFYHNHEFNNDQSADGNLRVYVNDKWEKINLNATNNPALLFYLTQYEIIFDTYKTRIKEISNKFFDKSDSKNDFVTRGKHIRTIEGLYLNAKGEELYFNALYNSIYNERFSLAHNNEEYKVERQCCFNIKNTIESINHLQMKALAEWQHTVTEKSIKYSLKGIQIGWAGFVIGILGIIIGYIVSQK
ncbi:MAG: hypothetical protein IKJ31_04135 [Bacteroidaceae bacterium]|nr:hypothetical protein [Bacteroidaceae bacterium]